MFSFSWSFWFRERLCRHLKNRSSLSNRSVKGLKTVKEALQNFGGEERIPITATLLNDVKKKEKKRLRKRMKLLKLKKKGGD